MTPEEKAKRREARRLENDTEKILAEEISKSFTGEYREEILRLVARNSGKPEMVSQYLDACEKAGKPVVVVTSSWVRSAESPAEFP